MNRRNFLSNLLTAGAGFAVLPAATTYARNWRGIHVPQEKYVYFTKYNKYDGPIGEIECEKIPVCDWDSLFSFSHKLKKEGDIITARFSEHHLYERQKIEVLSYGFIGTCLKFSFSES